MTDSASILLSHGFQFHNWPGPGEEAAAHFGLSHAVVVPPNTRTIIVGGQLGICEDGSVPADLTEEVEVAFEHVEKSLRAAGLGDNAWEHVYSVSPPKYSRFEEATSNSYARRKTQITTYEVEKDGQGIGSVVVPVARKHLKHTRPAWTGVTVKGLAFPGLHLEITVQAYLPI